MKIRPTLSALAATALLLAVSCDTSPDRAQSEPGDADDRAIVLVAGATGRTGQLVTALLIERGRSVRAFVRDLEKSESAFGDTADHWVGDVRERASIERAMEGVGLVVCAIGAGGGGQPGNRPEQVDFEGVAALVDAARGAGVRRFVLVSSMAVTRDEHPLNERFFDVLKWKLRGEDYLRASGLDYTIVRPGGLLDEPGGQATIEFLQGDRGSGTIPRADVARVCVEALGRDEASRKSFEIVSGEGPPTRDWAGAFASLAADPGRE